jgi:hypothetical protein
MQLDAWTEQYEADAEMKRQHAAAALADEGWTVVRRKGVSIVSRLLLVVSRLCRLMAVVLCGL